MLARRIIPCLDVRDGIVVKGEKFTNIKEIGDPSTLGEFYSNSGADELVFYDITASHEEREISLQFVEEVAKKISIPFCVGGGINSLEDIKKVLRKGADKISINSSAVKNPQLIKEGSEFFGAQCIVLSIDAKKKEDGNYSVFINGGRKDTGLDPVEWAVKGVKLGAGEIVLNSIDQDGVKSGYDCELLKMITDAVSVPVIASGGAGTMEHFLEAVEKSNVDGILAASIFHKGEIDITDLKKYLKQNNIEVRL